MLFLAHTNKILMMYIESCAMRFVIDIQFWFVWLHQIWSVDHFKFDGLSRYFCSDVCTMLQYTLYSVCYKVRVQIHLVTHTRQFMVPVYTVKSIMSIYPSFTMHAFMMSLSQGLCTCALNSVCYSWHPSSQRRSSQDTCALNSVRSCPQRVTGRARTPVH